MQQRLNTRLALWLLGITVVVALAICVVHDYQLRRNVPALLRQAEYAIDDGDFKRAARYLDAYLSYPLADVDALANYGIRLDKHATEPQIRAQVIDIFERVLERQPERHDIRHRLVWSSLSLYRLRDAEKQARLLLPNWANKAELHHIIAWCQNGLGAHEDAVASYDRAIAADPQRIEPHILRADILYEQLDRPEDAEAGLTYLVTTNPNSYRSYLARARLHFRRGDLRQALQDIEKARTLAPTNAEILLTAMSIAEARGYPDEARELGRHGSASNPKDARFCKALAALEVRMGTRAAAVQEVEQGLKNFPDDVELLVASADFLLEDGRVAEAKQLLGRLPKEAAEAGYIAAGIAYGERRWPEAIVMLEKLRTRVQGNAALSSRVNTLLGYCYERLNAGDQRAVAFERALSQDPDLIAARSGLAATFIEEGRIEQAIAALESLRGRSDVPRSVLLLLGRAHLLRTLQMPAALRNWLEIENLFDEIDRKAPGAPELVVLRAEALAAQRQFAAAEILLAGAIETYQRQPLLWCARLDLAVRTQQFDKARTIFSDAERELGDGVELRLAKARALVARGDPNLRRELPELAENLSNFDEQKRLQLLRGLATIAEQNGNGPLARSLWQRVVAQQPHDIGSWQQLFQLALDANQTADARRVLDEIGKIEGADSVFYVHGLAALAIQQAANSPQKAERLREAKRYLLEVNRRRPDWPPLPLLQARIAELEGDTETAINRHLTALERGQRQPQQVLKLVQLLSERRRFADAERALRDVEGQLPMTGALARLGAEIALGNNDAATAVSRARQAVRRNTNDYRELLWLAEICSRAGNHNEAEATLRRAVAVGGHVPETWVALARQLGTTGRRTSATQLLNDLQKHVPEDLVETTLARCHEALGDLDEASARFEEALEKEPHNPATLILAAEFYLRTQALDRAHDCLQILLGEKQTPADQIAWARRELAMLLGQRGSTDNHRAALALLDANKALAGSTLADERARFVVDGYQPRLRDQAIRDLTRSLQRNPASLTDQLRLLSLYENAGEFEKASSLALELLLTHPRDARLLAHQVRRLIRQEQFADAEIYLNRLASLEPKSARTRDLGRQLARARGTLTSANSP